VFVNVLNRSETAEITASIENQTGEVAGSIEIWELNHPDLKATHTFGDDQRVRPVVRTVTPDLVGGGFEYAFPAHSLTILKFRTP
jgi:alpha-N-arabinofuranosidase